MILLAYAAVALAIHFTGYHVTLIDGALYVTLIIVNTMRERAKIEANYWRDKFFLTLNHNRKKD